MPIVSQIIDKTERRKVLRSDNYLTHAESVFEGGVQSTVLSFMGHFLVHSGPRTDLIISEAQVDFGPHLDPGL